MNLLINAKLWFKNIFPHILFVCIFSTNSSVFAGGINDSSHLIFSNVDGISSIAIQTNLQTSLDNSCSKEDALYNKACNSFSLGDNEVQTIQSDNSGNLINQIGFDHKKATSYDNKGTKNQSNYFSDDKHLLQIKKYRNAADALSNRLTDLPLGTYGTISFSQFINNVANAQPMYGLVRVKVPLTRNQGNDNRTEKDDDERDDDERDDDESDDDDRRSKNKYRLCGEEPTAECQLCGPGIGTDIKPGNKVCGTQINKNSKILVYGSIFFDWIDCKTEDPIPLADLPSSPRDIYFSVSIPININPANPDASGAMASLADIPAVVGSNRCPGISPCTLPIQNPISYESISEESKTYYHKENNQSLTKSVFKDLTPAEKFSLLFPSGYESGWAAAFSELGVTASDWQSLGFKAPGDSEIIDVNDVKSDSFEDIPAYMYTGGLIDMHHHVNISGLVYVPQAIELEQKGYQPVKDKECRKESDDDSDDDEHDDDDRKEKDDDSKNFSKPIIHLKTAKTEYNNKSDHEKDDDDRDDDEHDDDDNKCESDDDEHDDDNENDDDGRDKDDDSKHDSKSNDDGHDKDDNSKHDGKSDDDKGDDDDKDRNDDSSEPDIAIPAKQYITGAILVRDSFYIEAKQPGGITVINNNPDTYSNIELSPDSPIGGKPIPFPTKNLPPGDNDDDNEENPDNNPGNNDRDGDGENEDGDESDDNSNSQTPLGNPGTQWIEIRPQ